ncbi:MAG: putative DNA binding domain-containing protein [Eubacteriales bacterium]|nr:putative DNA binding domain-containing protein [Eubacteriales bacterium]MDD3350030.1 putative DNA binding domain-containing protein [Eubacteriales bacterium]
MLYESETVELKQSLTDDISKEIVAFANTDGGTIYIGVTNDGTEVGLSDVDSCYTRLTNIVRDAIVPDVTMFVRYELMDNKLIKISISGGSAKPYYLKKNGIKPSGVYVRQGTSSAPATWDQIRNFIKLSDGDSFENMRCLLQELTFHQASEEFAACGIPFSAEKYTALGLQDPEKGLYTNLALLLSDQCMHTIKIAVFDDAANTVFLDRKEFSGSIFKQLHEAYDYLALNNRTRSIINGLYRTDSMDYPKEAIREALLNAIIHRDYSFSGSIIININEKHMEFISLGGLLPGLSTEDIMSGISQPRNPKLAQIFFRLKHVEAYGTGIRRIFSLYSVASPKPEIAVSNNTFRITLSNRNATDRSATISTVEEKMSVMNTVAKKITPQMREVLNFLSERGSISEEELLVLLKVRRTRAYLVGRQMSEMGLVDIVGRGKDKKYVLHKVADAK